MNRGTFINFEYERDSRLPGVAVCLWVRRQQNTLRKTVKCIDAVCCDDLQGRC